MATFTSSLKEHHSPDKQLVSPSGLGTRSSMQVFEKTCSSTSAKPELPQDGLSVDQIHRIHEHLHDRPFHRYEKEASREEHRIVLAWGRRNENQPGSYSGPDVLGEKGLLRLKVVVRHCIKKRWQKLGVWNPDWGIPGAGLRDHRDYERGWCWEWDRDRCPEPHFNQLSFSERYSCWPSKREECASQRAIRIYLEQKGKWDESIPVRPISNNCPAQAPLDSLQNDEDLPKDKELFLTSRPWYEWEVDIAEEEVKLRRDSTVFPTHESAMVNVTERWKAENRWEEGWTVKPGWKWQHESPSPELVDLNRLDFTPSERNVLRDIPPDTPPPSPPPYVPDKVQSDVIGIFSSPEELRNQKETYQQPKLRLNDGNDGNDGNDTTHISKNRSFQRANPYQNHADVLLKSKERSKSQMKASRPDKEHLSLKHPQQRRRPHALGSSKREPRVGGPVRNASLLKSRSKLKSETADPLTFAGKLSRVAFVQQHRYDFRDRAKVKKR